MGILTEMETGGVAEAEAGDGVEARWGVYGIPPREETTVGVGLNSVDSSSKAIHCWYGENCTYSHDIPSDATPLGMLFAFLPPKMTLF
jgi:hypothetical protein